MMSKKQLFLSGVATVIAGGLFAQSYVSVAMAQDKAGFELNAEQKVTARQVALLLDKFHYLEQPLDKQMGAKILTMYYDQLDPSRTLFLQSDIDEFDEKYADNFAERLKRGDLSAGVEVFERYRTRSNEYYDFAKEFLKTNVNLNTDKTIVLDREDAPRFKNAHEQ